MSQTNLPNRGIVVLRNSFQPGLLRAKKRDLVGLRKKHLQAVIEDTVPGICDPETEAALVVPDIEETETKCDIVDNSSPPDLPSPQVLSDCVVELPDAFSEQPAALEMYATSIRDDVDAYSIPNHVDSHPVTGAFKDRQKIQGYHHVTAEPNSEGIDEMVEIFDMPVNCVTLNAFEPGGKVPFGVSGLPPLNSAYVRVFLQCRGQTRVVIDGTSTVLQEGCAYYIATHHQYQLKNESAVEPSIFLTVDVQATKPWFQDLLRNYDVMPSQLAV